MEENHTSHSMELVFDEFCLKCFANNLQHSSLKVYKKHALKALLKFLTSESDGMKQLETLLLSNLEIVFEIIQMLLSLLASEDSLLISLCCEAIHVVCNITKHEEIIQILVSNVVALVLESCELAQVLPCIHLLGRLLDSFHGLSRFLVTREDKYLITLSSGILHLNATVSAEVLFTFLTVFKNEPKALYVLSDGLVRKIISDVCAVLATGNGRDATTNGLTLLRLFVSSQTCRHRLFFEKRQNSAQSSFDAIRTCIVHKDVNIQIAAAQILSTALESEFACQAQNRGREMMQRFLDENFAEHLFEALVSTNFLLLESSLQCLEIFESSESYFSYKHAVHAVPSLVRLCSTLAEKSKSASVLATALERLVIVVSKFDSAKNHCTPFMTYQPQVLTLVESVLTSPNYDVQQWSSSLLLLVLQKENIPKPVPVEIVKNLTVKSVQLFYLDAVSSLKKQCDGGRSGDELWSKMGESERCFERIRTVFELMEAITRLYIHCSKDPTMLLSSFAEANHDPNPVEVKSLQKLISHFLQLLPKLEGLSLDDIPPTLLISEFRFFTLCLSDRELAAEMIKAVGGSLLTTAVIVRNIAMTGEYDLLIDVTNCFLASILEACIPDQRCDWTELVKSLPADSSEWYPFLSERSATLREKETAVILIYFCCTIPVTNETAAHLSPDPEASRNLGIFISRYVNDADASLNKIVLTALWYLVATNCLPDDEASLQLLKILEQYQNLSEIYTNHISLLVWAHGSDTLCSKLGQITLLLSLEQSKEPVLPADCPRVLESLVSMLTVEPSEKLMKLAVFVIGEGGNLACHLAGLICENLSKILMQSPKLTRTSVYLTQLIHMCARKEETRCIVLDERVVVLIVGAVAKTEDFTLPDFLDFAYAACSYLQCSLLLAKGGVRTQVAVLMVQDVCFTSALTKTLQNATEKAKILNLVTTLASVLPADFEPETDLVLDMDDLLSSIDQSRFEDMIAALQIVLLAFKTEFQVPLLQFQFRNERVFLEGVLWKLENLAVKYASIADDLIWICLAEVIQYLSRSPHFIGIMSQETAIYNLVALKFDGDSLLNYPLECLLFLRNFLTATKPIEEIFFVKEQFGRLCGFLKDRVAESLRSLTSHFRRKEDRDMAEKEDCKFLVFKDIADQLGFSV